MSGAIVCAVDDSPQAATVGRVAVELAERLSLAAIFVRVVEGSSTSPPGATARERAGTGRFAGAQESLEQLVGELGGSHGAELVVRLGDAGGQVLQTATEHGARYIVVGARPLGRFRSLFSGSVSDAVVQRSVCPVVVVPADMRHRLATTRSVLCGVDGTETAEHAAFAAIGLARGLGLPLVLAHARRDTLNLAGGLAGGEPIPAGAPAEDELPGAVVRAAKGATARAVDVSAHVSSGAPDEVLARYAADEDAALVVVGRSEHARPRRSTAYRVLARAMVPVVAVPPVGLPGGSDLTGSGPTRAPWPLPHA